LFRLPARAAISGQVPHVRQPAEVDARLYPRLRGRHRGACLGRRGVSPRARRADDGGAY